MSAEFKHLLRLIIEAEEVLGNRAFLDLLRCYRVWPYIDPDVRMKSIVAVLRQFPKLAFVGWTSGQHSELEFPLFRYERSTMNFILVPGNAEVEPLLVAEFPVTYGNWSQSAGFSESKSGSDSEFTDYDLSAIDRPIEKLSWLEITRWLFEHELPLRLPKEVEWEHFGRYSFNEKDYPIEDFVSVYCCHSENSDGVRDYDSNSPCKNVFGLIDILGNLAEICEDRWTNLSSLPTSIAEEVRVIKGGNFMSLPQFLIIEANHLCHLNDTRPGLGFRPVMTVSVPDVVDPNHFLDDRKPY